MVIRVKESRQSPVKAAEKIQKLIAGLDFALEAVGQMEPELWSLLHDAQCSMGKAVELLKAYRGE